MANTKNTYGHDPDGLKLSNKPLQMIFPFTLNSLSSSINCLRSLHLHLALCLYPAEKDERVKTPVAPADTATVVTNSLNTLRKRGTGYRAPVQDNTYNKQIYVHTTKVSLQEKRVIPPAQGHA